MDDTLPRVHPPCEHCSALGVPFAVGGNGKNGLDEIIGIPSTPEAVTIDWFMSNPWIRDHEQNFRDTYLLRVLRELGKRQSVAWLAEFSAFVSSKMYQFVPLEVDMAEEADHAGDAYRVMDLAVPALGARKLPSAPTLDFSHSNCRFVLLNIYYWSFTSASYSMERVPNPRGDDPLTAHDWRISGQFDPAKAAAHLVRNYEQAKAEERFLESVSGAIEVALSFLPLGRIKLGASIVARGLSYTIGLLNRFLVADALIDGSSRIITGEGIDVGEKMFESLGALANPKNGKERASQVYMAINLAMVIPSPRGIARWVLRGISREAAATARLETLALDAEERAKLGGYESATAAMIEVRVEKKTPLGAEEGKTTITETPSLDTDRSVQVVESEAGKANFTVTAKNMRQTLLDRLATFNGDAKELGRLYNVVGKAGEEALAEALVEKWGIKAENIMGYRPKGESIFGLTNENRHGLDVLVKVPPPPSIEVRTPGTIKQRNYVDGLKGSVSTTELKFEQETVVVFEVKATLCGEKTPELGRKQASGATTVKRILDNIKKGNGVWNEKNRKAADPEGWETKYEAVENAVNDNRIKYIHAQVFFDTEGHINTLVGKGMGKGTGIQLNIW